MTRDKTTLAFYVAFYIYSCYTSFIEILQVWRWVFLKYLWILTIRTFEMTCGSLTSEKKTITCESPHIIIQPCLHLSKRFFGVWKNLVQFTSDFLLLFFKARSVLIFMWKKRHCYSRLFSVKLKEFCVPNQTPIFFCRYPFKIPPKLTFPSKLEHSDIKLNFIKTIHRFYKY